MSLFRGLFSSLTRPYSNVIRSLSDTGSRIKENVDTVKGAVDEAGVNKKKNVRYVDADNSKEAFELLFKENDWTEEELQKQMVLLRRSRFILFGISWFFSMGALFSFTHGVRSASLYSFFFALVFLGGATLILLSALRYAIYYEQMAQRNLITLKEFIDSGEYLRKLFG